MALAVGPPVFDLKMNSMRMWPVRGGEKPRIAQTGQTQCFNSWGQPLDCAGTGQDADIRAGIPFPKPRFIDNRDGTITDRLTELIWLKNANAFGTKSWQHALDACKGLEAGHAGLHDNSKSGDWRLPNLFELRSLMDYSAFNPSLTPGHPFDNVIPSLYWSSTTVASAPNLARFVFVGVGPSVWDHKSVLMHVWPMRGGVFTSTGTIRVRSSCVTSSGLSMTNRDGGSTHYDVVILGAGIAGLTLARQLLMIQRRRFYCWKSGRRSRRHGRRWVNPMCRCRDIIFPRSSTWKSTCCASTS